MSLIAATLRAASAVIVVTTVLLMCLSAIHPAVPLLKEGVVVITGCTVGGLGFQIARDVLMQQPKAVTVMCTVRKSSDASAIVAQLGTERLQTIIMDVTDKKGVDKLVSSLSGANVIGLVNNAGIGRPSPFALLDYRDIFEVNVFSVIDLTKALLPLLKKSGPGSRIVNIGSMAGIFTRPGVTAYSMSKRALEGVTDGMRIDLGPDGISVSIVDPGYFKTHMCTNPKICTGRIEDVSDGVLHGLFAERPRPRYHVGTVGLMSSYMASRLGYALPERVVDFLVVNLSTQRGSD